MSYAIENQPNQPITPRKGKGRPMLHYSKFLKSLYKEADSKRLSSLNVYRCEWKKKTMEELNFEIERHKKEIKHLEYIAYEKRIIDAKALLEKSKPPEIIP